MERSIIFIVRLMSSYKDHKLDRLSSQRNTNQISLEVLEDSITIWIVVVTLTGIKLFLRDTLVSSHKEVLEQLSNFYSLKIYTQS